MSARSRPRAFPAFSGHALHPVLHLDFRQQATYVATLPNTRKGRSSDTLLIHSTAGHHVQGRPSRANVGGLSLVEFRNTSSLNGLALTADKPTIAQHPWTVRVSPMTDTAVETPGGHRSGSSPLPHYLLSHQHDRRGRGKHEECNCSHRAVRPMRSWSGRRTQRWRRSQVHVIHAQRCTFFQRTLTACTSSKDPAEHEYRT